MIEYLLLSIRLPVAVRREVLVSFIICLGHHTPIIIVIIFVFQTLNGLFDLLARLWVLLARDR